MSSHSGKKIAQIIVNNSTLKLKKLTLNWRGW